ncbi:MAG: DNA-directed RNA polymerase subunit N [Candidatus Diapherotrites archaeon CG08_land_8_20_14_0_20_34_12]|nr:MAG: DNA-directed RNA polymerase subunit N [Candidatus Diapherotrites archaeon CG08_land_8_20_14_0_20_34_12]
MIIPIRCFTCGKPISEYYEKFINEIKTNKDAKKVLNDLGIKRYCCRRMLLSHVDLIDDIMKYKR